MVMQLLLSIAVLAPFVELAARVVAHPNLLSPRNVSSGQYSMPIVKHHFNFSQSGSLNIAQRNLIRSRNLMGDVQRRGAAPSEGIADVPATVNTTLGGYYASIDVGNPPTSYDLLIDTGSSMTWVGGNKPYVATDTSVKTSNIMNVTYGSGFMTGPEYFDNVTIASGISIPKQAIGVASNTSGFFPLDGILGLGPDDLTIGRLRPKNPFVVSTVTDSLFDQGTIGQKLVALSFEPTTSVVAINGEVRFGAIDPTKFTGDITYVPITSVDPSDNYWGINASFGYGDGEGAINLNTTAGVVDSGDTFLALATDPYNLYVKATGAVLDDATGLLRITQEQYNNLKSLFFEIGGTRFEFIPNAQIWPRALNTNIGGQEDSIYLAIIDIGTNRDGILDFMMGLPVLERLYTVFDSGNSRVGFATTQNTNAIIN